VASLVSRGGMDRPPVSWCTTPVARRRSAPPQSDKPYLRAARTEQSSVDGSRFPFTIPAFADGIDLTFDTKVTMFVGENGSGKSTLLEAIAVCCGFNPEGGNRNHHYERHEDVPALARALRLSWLPKVTSGFFLRAESFFNFASYLDAIGSQDAYGVKSLHGQSHGESFLALFTNRFTHGIYILDEPEAALSPQRQLAFLKIIHDLERSGRAQFIIATHSPILMSYPGSTIYSLDGNAIQCITAAESDHVRLTRDFLNAPERYFRRLFAPE